MGEATLNLYLEDAEGNPVEGAQIQVKGDMTHAGMAPVLRDFEEFGDGVYRADFEWTMGGDWILTLRGPLADGRILLRTYEISVGSAME
jgi:hypothetical protein